MKPIVPFEPVVAEHIPEGGEWVHQIKWDGVRMLTYYDGNEVRLINRNLLERTARYPELWDIRQYCTAESVILDGEMIAFDDHKPSFREIMRRDGTRTPDGVRKAAQEIPATYVVFDLVYLNGGWMVDKPLEERQSLIAKYVIPTATVRIAENYSDGGQLFAAMQSGGMEGIVSKRLSSAYAVNGKDARWMKRKIVRDVIAVVGGVTYRGNTVNSLLLGLRDGRGGLRYIGRAGAGRLTDEDWRTVTKWAESVKTGRNPFGGIPERSADAVWVAPELQVKVTYSEWTPGDRLRHPAIQSFVGRLSSEFGKNGSFAEADS